VALGGDVRQGAGSRGRRGLGYTGGLAIIQGPLMLSKLRCLVVGMVCLLGLVVAHAATINVGPGQTCTTIQCGINAASNGDTVLVAPGTYYENIDFLGKAITVTSSGGAVNTIIDGSLGKTSTVYFHHNETSSSVLNGFTIQGGGYEIYNAPPHNNAGVLISNGSPVISNNTITHNTCNGIQITGGPVIQNNEIDNTLDAQGYCGFAGGSAIWVDGAPTPLTIIGNLIQNNTQSGNDDAGGNGGTGITIWGGGAAITIIGNTIRNNRTLGTAGAIYQMNALSPVYIIGNLIYGNTAGGDAAMSFEAGGSTVGPFLVIVASNTIYGNTQTNPGGSDVPSNQVAVEGNIAQYLFVNNIIVGSGAGSAAVACGNDYVYLELTPVVFDHNDFYDPGGAAYGGSCPDQTGTYGNISANPQFQNPASGNFLLSAGSPAIDAGNNSAPLLPTTDIAGNVRIQDETGKGYPVVDMGAIESPGAQGLSPTFLTLTPSSFFEPNLSNFYEVPLIFTVTLSAASGTPTGPVNLYSDGKQFATVTIGPTGNATYSGLNYTTGVHVFLATYGGSPGFAPAVSVKFYLYIPTGLTSLTLTSSPNPTTVGTSVTFNVSATAMDGSIPSPVKLTDSSTSTLLATLTPDASGNASFSTSSLKAGLHTVVAAYTTNFIESSSSASVVEVVDGVSSETLQSSLNPSVLTQNVTFTAQLSSTGGVPTGYVEFYDGSTMLSTQPVSSAGVASYSTSALTIGAHTITATYQPTGTFTATSTNLSQVVNSGYPTVTTLSCVPSTIYVDSTQSALLSAVVTSSNGTPTGSIAFTDNGVALGTVGLVGGGATYSYLGTVVGTHTLTATYLPTGAFAGSSGSCSEVVVIKPSTTTIVSSLNPSNAGQSVTFTATVVYGGPAQSFAGAGSVTFTDGGTVLGTVTLMGTAAAQTFTASYTTSSLSATTHVITATLNPFVGYAVSSASLTQVVNPLVATAVLVALPVSEVYGTPTVLTATVAAANPPGVGTPTGNVIFSLDGTVLTTQALASGVAGYTIPALNVGTHVVTCAYQGDSAYAGVACNSVTIVVSAAATALTISSSVNPVSALSPVTFTVHMTVNGSLAGAGNAISLGAVASGGGVAPGGLMGTTDATGTVVFPESFVPGSYLMTATFAATSNLLGSSASMTEMVTINATSTGLTAVANPSYQGQVVTLTATVADTTGVVPVGAVSFEDAGTVIGAGTLNAAGVAVMTTSTLVVGTHPLTAVFAGNVSFAGSTSGVVPEVILPSTFTIALAPASITLPPGQTGKVSILLQSVGNFSGPLALTYGALPTYATASIAPASVTLAVGGTGTSTLTLNTLMKSSNEAPQRPFGAVRVFEVLVLMMVPVGLRRRRMLSRVLGLVVALVVMQAMVGCTNAWFTGNVVTVGTYTVPVTATDVNHNTQTAVLTVVVTP